MADRFRHFYPRRPHGTNVWDPQMRAPTDREIERHRLQSFPATANRELSAYDVNVREATPSWCTSGDIVYEFTYLEYKFTIDIYKNYNQGRLIEVSLKYSKTIDDYTTAVTLVKLVPRPNRFRVTEQDIIDAIREQLKHIDDELAGPTKPKFAGKRT